MAKTRVSFCWRLLQVQGQTDDCATILKSCDYFLKNPIHGGNIVTLKHTTLKLLSYRQGGTQPVRANRQWSVKQLLEGDCAAPSEPMFTAYHLKKESTSLICTMMRSHWNRYHWMMKKGWVTLRTCLPCFGIVLLVIVGGMLQGNVQDGLCIWLLLHFFHLKRLLNSILDPNW